MHMSYNLKTNKKGVLQLVCRCGEEVKKGTMLQHYREKHPRVAGKQPLVGESK